MTPDRDLKIHLGGLAWGIGMVCMHSWASLLIEPPDSLEGLWTILQGQTLPTEYDAESWQLLERTEGALELGNDGVFYWRFRQDRGFPASVRLGMRRGVAQSPAWEVELEGPWHAAEVSRLRVAPLAADWLKTRPRMVGLLGQFWADGQRAGDTAHGRALRSLALGIEQWALLNGEANGMVLMTYARWDGLVGEGALLREPLDLNNADAVFRRREYLQTFREVDDFRLTRKWKGV